jgi:hypothetical protein
VSLINTDGLAIFGPGSEWFWTMAQFAALAITGFAIYRQLQAQRWANQAGIVSHHSDYFDSEQMVRFKLTALTELRDGKTGLSPAQHRVGDFFENTALAQRNGHMVPRYAREEFSAVAQTYWALLAPAVPAARQREPELWTAWERWVGELAGWDAKAGSTADVSPEHLAWWITDAIAYYTERLPIESETRATDVKPGARHRLPDVDGHAAPDADELTPAGQGLS